MERRFTDSMGQRTVHRNSLEKSLNSYNHEEGQQAALG